MNGMFKHFCGWALNARILRLQTDYEEHCRRRAQQSGEDPDYLARIVREEIAQDHGLVWC